MSLSKIIKQKADRLSSVPTGFEKNVVEAQKTIFDDLLGLLDQLDRKDGFIVINAKNLSIIDEITEKTKESILGGEYVQAIKEFASEFDNQAELSNEYFKKEFYFTDEGLQVDILKQSKKNAVELLVSGVETDFVLPLKQILTESVASGTGYVDMVKAIRLFAEGNGTVDGKLLRYSKQIAHDTFAVSDATYTNAIAEDLDIEWYYYGGGEITGTRKFCHDRNGKYFHKKEVENWSSEEWQGKKEGTNQRTIFNYRGGYNCMHSLSPVSIFLVNKEVIQRNIDNGNYKPTKFEIEELGLVV